MSRQRRNFSAKFKSDLVIELLKGEKDLHLVYFPGGEIYTKGTIPLTIESVQFQTSQ